MGTILIVDSSERHKSGFSEGWPDSSCGRCRCCIKSYGTVERKWVSHRDSVIGGR